MFNFRSITNEETEFMYEADNLPLFLRLSNDTEEALRELGFGIKESKEDVTKGDFHYTFEYGADVYRMKGSRMGLTIHVRDSGLSRCVHIWFPSQRYRETAEKIVDTIQKTVREDAKRYLEFVIKLSVDYELKEKYGIFTSLVKRLFPSKVTKTYEKTRDQELEGTFRQAKELFPDI